MYEEDEVSKKSEIYSRFHEINDNLFPSLLIWVYEIPFNHNFPKSIEVWKLTMPNIQPNTQSTILIVGEGNISGFIFHKTSENICNELERIFFLMHAFLKGSYNNSRLSCLMRFHDSITKNIINQMKVMNIKMCQIHACTYVFMCYLINRFSTSMGLSRKGLIPKSTSCY